MNKKNIIVGVVAALVGGISTLGYLHFSQCAHGGHHGKYGHGYMLDADNMRKGVDKFAAHLDLSAEQKTKLYKLSDKIAKEMPAYRKTKDQIRIVFLEQFESDTFHTQAVDTVLVGAENDVPKMRKFIVETTAEFHEILTPEQRAKLVEKWKRHHKK